MEILIVKRGALKKAKENALKDAPSFPLLILERDHWNDLGYLTSCRLHVVRGPDTETADIGLMRVIKKGQEPGKWTFSDRLERIPTLPSKYCSMGASNEFYSALLNLGPVLARRTLKALNDAALTSAVWKRFENQPAFRYSILRDTSAALGIRDRVGKLFGQVARRITNFHFTFRPQGAAQDLSIRFDFRSHRGLPGRFNLLVGPNGAGKTQLLSRLAIALSGVTSEEGGEEPMSGIDQQSARGKRDAAGIVSPLPSFYSIIALSFNAFDTFEIPVSKATSKFSYTYCGLRRRDGRLQSNEEVTDSIVSALNELNDEKRSCFRSAASRLLPQYASVPIGEIPYWKLSAGQKMALNVVTHLIAKLKEHTLVLFDEPETHLHPTLITSLLSEVSRLLALNKSHAIVATHSPLIAQQIPSTYIKILGRVGGAIEVSRPCIECFGASLSDLSGVLFESTEHRRDYTHILDDLLKKDGLDAERVEGRFPNGLSDNARFYLLSAASRPRS